MSVDNLNKVGKLYFKTGAQTGANLKKTLIGIGGGKTRTQFDKKLKELGISGSQINKRNAILKLAYGDKKIFSSGEDQIKRNLNFARSARIREESDSMRGGVSFAKQYAGGKEVQSHGVMGNIGVDIEKRGGKIGFASDYKK
ncbi:MAG: hypothetical protein V1667_04190 [bacterium]